jgi:hypothetical protein
VIKNGCAELSRPVWKGEYENNFDSLKSNFVARMKANKAQLMIDRITLRILFTLGCVLVLALIASAAHAQIPVTLTATPATSDGTVPVTLSWTATGATTCTASGAWTGTKAVSGSQTISPPIAATAKYDLTCSAGASATVTWALPTRNTNGTPLTLLSGFRVNYGPSATSMPQFVNVTTPTTTVATVPNLPAGTTFFTVTTLTSDQQSSVPSNPVSAVITGSTGTASATHTVTAVPSPPSNVTVRSTDQIAWEIRTNATGVLTATRIGVIPVGIICSPEVKTIGAVVYNRIDTRLVDLVSFPASFQPIETWARCS